MLDCITRFICPSPLSLCYPSFIENAQNHTERSINAKMIEKESFSHMDTIWSVVEKVKEVAIFVLTTIFTGFLFYVDPSLFTIGFLAGIIFDDKIEETIEKIKNVRKNLGYVLGLCACVLTLPVSFATVSMIWSARLGALLSKDYPSSDEKNPPPPVVDEKNQMIPAA